jgi:hypothetical protein
MPLLSLALKRFLFTGQRPIGMLTRGTRARAKMRALVKVCLAFYTKANSHRYLTIGTQASGTIFIRLLRLKMYLLLKYKVGIFLGSILQNLII